jgi:predicted nucleotidyltransferase component of viral defense system
MAVTDMGASVLAKLKTRAKTTGKPFQLYLQLFCQEEFLRRLSRSSYVDNLILKGGLFIYELTGFQSRPTVDIDFLLQHLPGGIERIKEAVNDILQINTGNKFIILEAQGYEAITPQRKYAGISFQIIGHIKNTKTPFTVDIGLGDIIIPSPQKRIIPGQLEGFSEPEINTYSLESTISEKLDAILQRLELTSRMKDFYDIYYLSHTFDFDGTSLQQAFFETLKNRGTPYSRDSIKMILELTKDTDLQTRWKQFVKRIKLPDLNFHEVLQAMDTFLRPVWIAMIEKKEYLRHWSSNSHTWEPHLKPKIFTL